MDIGYYHTGSISYKIPYVNGKRHGMSGGWAWNGNKSRQRMWRDGKQHGADTIWALGKKEREEMWLNNSRHGVTTYWYISGKKQKEVYYLHHQIHTIIEWAEKGNVTSTYFPTLPNPTIMSMNPSYISSKKPIK